MTEERRGTIELPAIAMAHRAVLVHLVKIVEQYIPAESGSSARDATVAMLHNSMHSLFAGFSDSERELAISAAQEEVDRIFHAPW